MNKPSEKALEEIKSKVSAASWDHADDMQKSVLANEIWWIAHNALEAAALARAEDGEGPVPWGWANKHGAVTRFLPEKWREIGHELTPLYTHPGSRPTIRAYFETVDATVPVTGSTDAPIKRVEQNDDGSYTVVIDYWPGPQASGPVEVKPLEWELEDDGWWVTTALDYLSYEIRQGRANTRVRFPGMRQFEPFEGDIQAAKAAAQADYERRILSALTSSKPDAPQAVPSGWQPMETAPKDGTCVLVGHEQGVFAAWWQEKDTDTGEPGWVDGVTNQYDEYLTYPVTNWMPLPAAPTAGGEDAR